MFTREFLFRLQRKALRKGVWKRVLDHTERGIVNLAYRLFDRVRSEVLGVVLVRIVDKLKKAMRSEFVKIMELSSIKKVRAIVKYVLEWGNSAAKDWAYDRGFVRFLTQLALNEESNNTNKWKI